MIQPGDPAPDFELPAANAEGTVALAAYRARRPVLVALFRGLYCPFCRQQMGRLSRAAPALRAAGIEPVGIVATAADRARMYFRMRPLDLPLGADPDLRTHRAYGLGHLARDAAAHQMVETAARQLALDLRIEIPPGQEARQVVDRADGFAAGDSDKADRERHQIQLTGQFLVDREGIVRWCNHETAATYAVFPDDKMLLSRVTDLGGSA
jgi:peroxiredoxin